MPKTEVLETWAGQVPEGFTFVLKASQRISHQAKLKPPEAHDDSMAYLWKVAAGLGGKLGPVPAQGLGRLREFAAATIAPHQRVAMELQHPSWEGDDVDTALADCGIARCIADKDDGSARRAHRTLDLHAAAQGRLHRRRDAGLARPAGRTSSSTRTRRAAPRWRSP